MESGGSGRARVVRVVDRDAAHPELVEDALARRRVPVAVACDARLDVVVVDARVQEGFDPGFEAEFGIGAGLARLDEGGQADAEDVGGDGAGVGGHGVV